MIHTSLLKSYTPDELESKFSQHRNALPCCYLIYLITFEDQKYATNFVNEKIPLIQNVLCKKNPPVTFIKESKYCVQLYFRYLMAKSVLKARVLGFYNDQCTIEGLHKDQSPSAIIVDKG